MTLPSQFDGTCPVCNTSFKQGEQIYLQKKDGKWIKCKDKDCFLQQGGEIKEQGKFMGRKRLTAEEARAEHKKLWHYALDDAADALPAHTTPEEQKARMILAQVFYKTMAELMK